MEITRHPDLPDEGNQKREADRTKAEKKALRTHSKMITALREALEDNSDLKAYVQNSQDAYPVGANRSTHRLKWKSGQAHLIIQSILKEYRAESILDRCDLWAELAGVRVINDEKPVEIFRQAYEIRNRWLHHSLCPSDKDMLAVIANGAGERYKTLIITRIREMEDANTAAALTRQPVAFTIAKMIEVLRSLCNEVWKGAQATEKQSETSLAMYDQNRQQDTSQWKNRNGKGGTDVSCDTCCSDVIRFNDTFFFSSKIRY